MRYHILSAIQQRKAQRNHDGMIPPNTTRRPRGGVEIIEGVYAESEPPPVIKNPAGIAA